MGSLAHQVLDLIHVVDFAISNDQQNLVGHGVLLRVSVSIELLENLAEVGRTGQLDVLELLSVATEDVLDAVDARVVGITIQSEAVVSLMLLRGNASETEGREDSV